jgi:hypothetical protein
VSFQARCVEIKPCLSARSRDDRQDYHDDQWRASVTPSGSRRRDPLGGRRRWSGRRRFERTSPSARSRGEWIATGRSSNGFVAWGDLPFPVDPKGEARVAALAPGRKAFIRRGESDASVARLAYGILVHKNPEQVRRLLERLRDPAAHFYVNVFKAKTPEARRPWERAFQGLGDVDLEVVYKYGPSWGAFGLIDATLDAMRHFRPLDYDYFVNMSGQCYPLQPMEEIGRKLSAASSSWMTFREVVLPGAQAAIPNGGPSQPEPTRRRPERFTHRYYRLARHDYGVVVKVPRLRRSLPDHLVPYRGSQWICLRKDHVDYVLDYVEGHPAVPRYFRRSGIPDETFFQTILASSPLRDQIRNETIRYFALSGGEPVTLTMKDLAGLLASDKPWARKFDIAVDVEILDELDRLRLRPTRQGGRDRGA